MSVGGDVDGQTLASLKYLGQIFLSAKLLLDFTELNSEGGGVLGKGGLYLTDTFLHGFALHHSAKKSLVVIYKRYFTHIYPLTIAFLPPSIIMFSPFIN